MNLLGVEYSLSRRAIEVFLAGCNAPHCKGCHLPESWDFNGGEPITASVIERLQEMAYTAGDLVDKFMIMGGEPTHQQLDELLPFLQSLEDTGKEIWLFTRNVLQDVPEEVLPYLSKIKCGPYVDTLKCSGYISHGVELASSNQMIYDLRGISS